MSKSSSSESTTLAFAVTLAAGLDVAFVAVGFLGFATGDAVLLFVGLVTGTV